MNEGENIQQYVADLENELANQESINRNLSAKNSMFGMRGDADNIVKWQLDLSEVLERIDHLLRGHVVSFDEKGRQIYEEPKDESLKPFNDYGVQLLMKVISMYLNQNTILSNYDEDTIMWKVLDFGNEINDLIYMKYEDMGLNTDEKKKLYPMVVREIVDTVHSAYLRALNGGERESLRRNQELILHQNAQNMGGNMQMQNQRRFSIFKPTTWITG